MPRVLLVTSNPFWHRRGGSQRRIASLIEGFQRADFEIEVAFAGRLAEQELAAASRISATTSLGVNLPATPPDAKIEVFASDSLRESFLHLVSNRQPDVVVIEYIRLAFLVDAIPDSLRNRTTLVLDTHDVMHQRAASFHAYGLPHWVDISRNEEAAIIQRFDIAVAIQQKDADDFAAMSPATRVVTAPYAINSRSVQRNSGPPAVGFIGVDSPPNRDTLAVILNEIWPTIRAGCTDAQLVLAGEIAHNCPEDMAGLVRLGRIDDPDEFHSRIDLLLNPVRIGGGLKIKNVEALAAGRPVVTTSLGGHGFEGATDVAVSVADDPGILAAQAARLLTTPSALSKAMAAAHTYATCRFNPSVAYPCLINAIQQAIASRQRPHEEEAAA